MIIHTLVVAVTAAAVAGTAHSPRPRSAVAPPAADTVLPIPRSVWDDHLELTTRLREAGEEPGRVGEAARELGALLRPHLAREERIVLPPLGMLAALAEGRTPVAADEVLARADSLRAEWPRMVEEHRGLQAAVDRFDAAARAEARSLEHAPLVDLLRRHERMDEEVLHPAALLAAEVLRARRVALRRH